MLTIPKEQILLRMQAENVWWLRPHLTSEVFRKFRRRAYFEVLFPLVSDPKVRRAVLLMGPRRVGKTVLMFHCIQELLEGGINPRNIAYLAVDHPIYNGCSLENFLGYCSEASGADYRTEVSYLFLDEIQYLREWEVHLKVLVDTYPNLRILASGSAAAALRIKSRESGAGRFTDFLLPPLTFYEYLDLLGKTDLIGWTDDQSAIFPAFAPDIEALNGAFVHYLNFGGYPEVIFSEAIQADPGRFIKSDIIDKVLLRDLPSLYGIQDIQELNYLFTTLAFNTAGEVSLEGLAKNAGVSKNTIKRYIEYLEAAFLIKTIHRIDRTGKRFQRANFFKVYLTNPSIRTALFSPLDQNDETMGSLAETGIFSQWFHYRGALSYARWDKGEVDLVYVQGDRKIAWAVEVKWSDRYVTHPGELKSVIRFASDNRMGGAAVTTRSLLATRNEQGVTITFIPTALYCYAVGFNLIKAKGQQYTASPTEIVAETPDAAKKNA
ncbi:MAG: ATP-binding protein [Gemmatimonadaceae bacterium]